MTDYKYEWPEGLPNTPNPEDLIEFRKGIEEDIQRKTSIREELLKSDEGIRQFKEIYFGKPYSLDSSE